ncbi:MAG: LysE family translocator [Pseudomonadota bacterium]|nr:LysE family translocator [Pseudomonadota bacterium]
MLDIPRLVAYLLVMSITPGPNNVMVTASGAAFGYRATLPHVLGIGVGASLQTVLVCSGLGAVFVRYPILHAALAWAGALYLVYLAWQLARSGEVSSVRAARPMTFVGAALFQAINPKAWVMAITTAAVFLPRAGIMPTMILIVGLTFLMINIPCVSVWALFGSAMRRALARPGYRRAFNLTMSALLVLTAIAGVRGH